MHVEKLLATFDDVKRVDPAEIGHLDGLATRGFASSAPRAAFLVGLTTNFGNRHTALLLCHGPTQKSHLRYTF